MIVPSVEIMADVWFHPDGPAVILIIVFSDGSAGRFDALASIRR